MSHGTTDDDIAADNVYDFVEHKLHRMINDYAQLGLDAAALQLTNVLDKYLAGDIDVVFQDGMPYYYVVKPDSYDDDM